MKPTHQLKTGTNRDVCAWQNDRKSSVPIWVFRNFHDLGGAGVLTHRSGEKVQIGDWICIDMENRKNAIVLTNGEFQEWFVEIPVKS